MAVRVPGRRQQADPRQHFGLALVLDIRRAVEVDPFTDRVVVERTRVGELARLDVDRHAREEAVPAAVVVMQVGVDDAGDVARDVLGVRRRTHIADLGPRIDHPGVDKHPARGVVACPDEYGQRFAVCDEIRCEVGVDRGHHCLAPKRFAHNHAPGCRVTLVCRGALKSRPAPHQTRFSSQTHRSSSGRRKSRPGTFAGSIADLMRGLLGVHSRTLAQPGFVSAGWCSERSTIGRVDELVPRDFDVPRRLETPLFVLEPLGPEHNAQDYDAWTSSMEQLHATPGWQDSNWPREMTLRENRADLQRHADDFRNRTGFTYTVLDPASRDVIGCVYIYPRRDSESDARAHSWLRASHAHLDAPLWRAVSEWLASEWPFASVEYAPRA